MFTGNKEPVVLARSGELPQDLAMENVCPTISSHERPKAARNKAGQFRLSVYRERRGGARAVHPAGEDGALQSGRGGLPRSGPD